MPRTSWLRGNPAQGAWTGSRPWRIRERAELRSGNGYPTRYVSKAKDILPLLSKGQPPEHMGFAVIGDDYLMPAGWTGGAKFHHQRIAACSPDDKLVVDAWDQS